MAKSGTYSRVDVEHLLEVQRRLVNGGLDPDYAELKVLRIEQADSRRPPAAVAAEILEEADPRWKSHALEEEAGETGGEDGEGESETDVYDRIRNRARREREEKRREPSLEERLGY